MNIKDYEYIVTIAEMGSITKAAEKLYITPGALTKYLQRVEQQVGMPVFRRIGSQYLLTRAGQCYVEKGRKIIRLDRELEEELQAISSTGGTSIRLGYPMGLSSFIMERILPEFHRRYLQVSVHVTENGSRRLTEYMEKGMEDICIAFLYPAERTLRMDYHKIGESRMVLAMCDQMNVSPSKAIFPVGFVAVSTCGVFPVGSGAVSYATQNGYLESFGAVERFEVLDFFKARIPVLLVIMLYAIFIASRFAPDKPPVPLTELSSKKGKKEQAPLSPVREKLALLIFALVTVELIFQSQLPLESWQITLMGAVLMVGFGVLSSKEALNAIPLRIVCMYIGALSLAAGLTATGAGDVIGNWLSSIVGDVKNGYVIGALFFLLPFLLTQVMQNQSVANIFTPIAIMGCEALGVNPLGPLILVQSASLTAYMTPMATGTVPLMRGAGGYDIKSLMKQGWLPAILVAVVSIFWTMTLFPAFG